MLTSLYKKMRRLSCLYPVIQVRWWLGRLRVRLVLGCLRMARICPDLGDQEYQCYDHFKGDDVG